MFDQQLTFNQLIGFANDSSQFKIMLQALTREQQFQLLTMQTLDGNTLLHHAAAMGNLSTVQFLLGMEARMDIANQAQKLPIDLAKDAGHSEIVSLLRTRTAWLSKLGNQRIPLNHALGMIQGCYQAIEPGRNRDVVLVLGETGVGKSTLLNYLNGAQYELAGTPRFDLHTHLMSGQEVARVGHNPAVSETLYPQVLRINSLDMADLSGFNGVREPVVELAGTLSSHLLSKLVHGVKGILFVIDIDSLLVAKGGNFRNTIHALNRILQGNFNSKTARSVHFAITKLPPGLTVNQVLETKIRPLQEQLLRDMQQGGVNEEDIALSHTIELMLNSPERIFLPNVCDDGASRDKLVAALKGSPMLASQDLNLLQMDRHQETFLSMMTFLASEHSGRYEKIKASIPTQLQQKTDLLTQKEQDIAQWTRDMAAARAAKDEGLTPAMAIAMIEQRQARAAEIEQKLQSARFEQNQLIVRIAHSEEVVRELDTDEPTAYGNPYRFQHIGEVEVIEGGTAPANDNRQQDISRVAAAANPILRLAHPALPLVGNFVAAAVASLFGGGGGGRQAPPQIRPKAGTGIHTFKNDNKPAPGPIVDLQLLEGTASHFGQSQINGNTFSLEYTYPLGQSDAAAVMIQLAKRDIPSNHGKIEHHRENMSVNTGLRNGLTQQLETLVAELSVINNEIAKMQLQGIDAATQIANLDHTIQQREEWVATAYGVIATITGEMDSLNRETAELEQELTVNHDIFKTMVDIIQALSLGNGIYPALQEFVNQYQQLNPAPYQNMSGVVQGGMFAVSRPQPGVNFQRPNSQPNPGCLSEPRF